MTSGERLRVRKTYKQYVGGAFARSESGRHLAVLDHAGLHRANVPRGSRKDVRDAVRCARAAFGGWAGRTAYNRGQVLYRAAEALEARALELAERSASLRGVAVDEARAEVEAAEGRAGEAHGVAHVLARAPRDVGAMLAGVVEHEQVATRLAAGERPVEVQLIGLAHPQALAARHPSSR